jgi:hypothetical protein
MVSNNVCRSKPIVVIDSLKSDLSPKFVLSRFSQQTVDVKKLYVGYNMSLILM